MNWTKIPTDLLESRTPDKELIAIFKYQLLWASLERQPDKTIALRFMSEKQYEIAMQYLDSIKKQIDVDIRHVCKHRNCQKLYYDKKQTLSEKSDNQYDNQCDSHTERADKIREDNIPPIIPQMSDDSGFNPVVGDKDLQDIKQFELWRSQQAGYKKSYETVTESKPQDKPIKSYAFCGHVIKLNDKDFKDWKERYSNLDLVKELSGLDDWYDQHGDKNWFIRAQKELDKRNKVHG